MIIEAGEFHACTDMTHYIQVRCVSQARNAFRCNSQVQNEARRPGMGKSIAKARLCQRGKGPYLTTFHLPLLNPLPLLKHSHALLMPCPCRPPASARCTRSITKLLVTTDSATAYRAPASLSSLVCHTGSPRWFATQALLPQLVALAASPIFMPFVDTLLPTLEILPRSSPSSTMYSPLHVTQTRHRPSDPSPEPAAQRCSSPAASSSSTAQICCPHPPQSCLQSPSCP